MWANFNYKRKLFLYYFAVFFIVTASFFAFQYKREKQYRITQLENSLNNVTDITNNFIARNNLIAKNNTALIDSLLQIITAKDTRLTVIDNNGEVLYDNFVDESGQMENHLNRPEVQKAKFSDSGAGSDIRTSATTGQAFYYYAHSYNSYFIRAAVVYDLQVQDFLKAERLFLTFIAFLFIATWLILSFVTRKMSESITNLKDFAVQLRQNKPLEKDYKFPKNELGVIGKQIVSMYKKLAETKNALSLEKEKLIKHLFVLNEGVGFFTSDKKALLTNTHFVQYLNQLAEESSIHPEHIFNISKLDKLHAFLKKYAEDSNAAINQNALPQIEFTLQNNGHYFVIKSIVFPDKSFEIYINDVTKPTKRKLLKQQMTSNIAHELKTPVASVSGYLETILNNKQIPEDKKDYFIEKAYKQAIRLKNLVEDIVVLNTIEEEVENYDFGSLPIKKVVHEVVDNFESLIRQRNANVEINIDESVNVKGNRYLIKSVFQNLIDNALNYAGDNIKLQIDMYHQDKVFYYFSVIDNGVGIPEKHLPRIFERFYRIDSGRSRKMGGTGLGLAIVKHAVNMHKGKVSVTNAPNGGAEFYFTLPKFLT